MRAGNLRNCLLVLGGYVLFASCNTEQDSPTACMEPGFEGPCPKGDASVSFFSYVLSLLTSMLDAVRGFFSYVSGVIVGEASRFTDKFSEADYKTQKVSEINPKSINETEDLSLKDVVPVTSIVDEIKVKIVNPTSDIEVKTANPAIGNEIEADASQQNLVDSKVPLSVEENVFTILSIFSGYMLEISVIVAILSVTCYLVYLYVIVPRTESIKSMFKSLEYSTLAAKKRVSDKFKSLVEFLDIKKGQSSPIAEVTKPGTIIPRIATLN